MVTLKIKTKFLKLALLFTLDKYNWTTTETHAI